MCKHDKVYESKLLTSYPPKQKWICRKCGEQGMDIIGELECDDYEELLKIINQ